MTLPEDRPRPKHDDDRPEREPRRGGRDDDVKDAPTRGGSNVPNAGKDASEERME